MTSQPSLPFTPLIIIGAGRSGTNALRDSLVKLPNFGTWPCDEINPIWRHGNLFWPNDEFTSDHANSKVKRFIRNAFLKIWKKQRCPDFVIEKTCANTLRVPFVNSILPEAIFIEIVRNGEDVVASAQKRWKGELEVAGLPYFLAKARYVPITDFAVYGFSFLKKRLNLILNKNTGLGIWGPRISGLDSLKTNNLDTICAMQWSRCVELSNQALAEIEPERVIKIRYESFVSDPKKEISKIVERLKLTFTEEEISYAVSSINSRSIGNARKTGVNLSDDALKNIEVQMKRNGYMD